MKNMRLLAFTLFMVSASGVVASAGYHSTGDEYVPSEDARYYPAVLEVESEQWLDSLESVGAKILHRRGDLALAYIPIDDAGDADGRRKMPPRGGDPHRGRIVRPTLDRAMQWYGASRVFSGEGLPRGFDGEGVVVGICDIGFDPYHPTFLDEEGSPSRIKRIVQYRESQGLRTELNTPEEYAAWGTDTVAEWHATHVAGILAGNGGGTPYVGVARGADIVVTTSQLSDVGLLAGVEDILEYARSVGKPAVVNLSMGSYNGPHDGTSLFSRYMDMLGEEAIICMSAGNEGNRSNTLSFEFTEARDSVSTWIGSRDYANYNIYGLTDVWLDDSSELRINLFVYDSDTGNAVCGFPVLRFPADGEWWVSSEDNAEFGRYFDGMVKVSGGVWPGNGRRYAKVEYDLATTAMSGKGKWARYNLGLTAGGVPGTRMDIYADGSYSCLRSLYGNPVPGSDASFSDLSTGHNLISVGMYNNAGIYEPGEVNVNSGYATLIDGRVMPLTVAPGAQLVSSVSRLTVDEPRYPVSELWAYEAGTSMSSPYVAGFVATWLQANPDLDVDDVKSIIESTNMHDYPDAGNPRHGQGWFNPYEGLRKAIEMSGVGETDCLSPAMLIVVVDRELRVTAPGGEDCRVEVYDLSGGKVAAGMVGSGNSGLSLAGLAPGLYVATCRAASGAGSHISQKIMIR